MADPVLHRRRLLERGWRRSARLLDQHPDRARCYMQGMNMTAARGHARCSVSTACSESACCCSAARPQPPPVVRPPAWPDVLVTQHRSGHGWSLPARRHLPGLGQHQQGVGCALAGVCPFAPDGTLRLDARAGDIVFGTSASSPGACSPAAASRRFRPVLSPAPAARGRRQWVCCGVDVAGPQQRTRQRPRPLIVAGPLGLAPLGRTA